MNCSNVLRRASRCCTLNLSNCTRRKFSSTSVLNDGYSSLISEHAPKPVTHFTEDEKSIQLAVEKFANERMQPLVKDMDVNGQMDQTLIDELFSNGFMGIEIPTEYGGVGTCLLFKTNEACLCDFSSCR